MPFRQTSILDSLEAKPRLESAHELNEVEDGSHPVLRSSRRLKKAESDVDDTTLPTPSDSSDTSSDNVLPEGTGTHMTLTFRPKKTGPKKSGPKQVRGARQAPPLPTLKKVAGSKVTKRKAPTKRSTAVRAPIKKKQKMDMVTRPEPVGKPVVWSEDRQAFCETIPQFRAYNSAAYSNDGLIHGMLLARDDVVKHGRVENEYVIFRSGGGCVPIDGANSLAKSLSLDDTMPMAWDHTMQARNPIYFAVARANELIATEPPHQLNTLGYFHITDIWQQRYNEDVNVVMVRAEKCNLEELSWWALPGTPQPPKNSERDFSIKCFTKVCASCSKTWSQIYAEGWMCLNGDCESFHMIDDLPAPEDLHYAEEFLNKRTHYNYPIQNEATYRPSVKEILKREAMEEPYSRKCWKGIICSKCGACISRKFWTRFECPHCDFVLEHQPHIIRSATSMNPHGVSSDFADWSAKRTNVVELTDMYYHGNWKINSYKLSEGNTFHHFQSNTDIHNEPSGPNAMFLSMQKKGGSDIQRGKLTNHNMGVGVGLASHFAMNYGMTYKYGVTVPDADFASAPQPILDGMSYMQWMGKHVAGKVNMPFIGFNELLAIGYYTDGKMSYHDDGEDSLEPMVATLALGSSAAFKVRMKLKYHIGITKTGNYLYDDRDVVLPGCWHEKARRELESLRHHMTLDEYHKARDHVFATGPSKGQKNEVMLHLNFKHGDCIIMNGADMQKYYEHQVEPSGNLRFALTARFVKPECVEPGDRWKSDFPMHRITPYTGYETQGNIMGTMGINPELLKDMAVSKAPLEDTDMADAN